jgi:hypothetical protein
LNQSETAHFFNVENKEIEVHLNENTLGFTVCQVPAVYRISNQVGVTIHLNDDSTLKFENLKLDEKTSHEIFNRTGKVSKIEVFVTEQNLRG